MKINLSPSSQKQRQGVIRQYVYQSWRGAFYSARTRILALYIILLVICTTLSFLALRPLLLNRLEQRINESLVQEGEEFRRFINQPDPETGQAIESLQELFKSVLTHNVPDDDEFLLAFVNGQLYKSSPRAIPTPLNSGLAEQIAQLNQPKQGEITTNDETFIYLAEPVRFKGERGVFLIAHALSGEQEEVDEASITLIEITIFGWLIASILAWVASGNVLAPLRSLTKTARSISESDLSQRISVRGSGEIADLTTTFNEMMDRLQATFASQREFISDAGHELRTPITIIRGHLELMGDDPEEQRETLELVIDELDRMSRFVDDLLLLAKAEQPNFLNPEIVDVSLLTEELYSKAKALGERNWCLDSKSLGRVKVDRQRITQAVMNLADNATQHTKVGDIIAIGSTLNDRNVRFWVRDTGAGIALAEQERIFERFARILNQRRRPDGAGLGLSIVRAIAVAHGGQVELTSQLGIGSTFTIVIPVKSANKPRP